LYASKGFTVVNGIIGNVGVRLNTAAMASLLIVETGYKSQDLDLNGHLIILIKKMFIFIKVLHQI